MTSSDSSGTEAAIRFMRDYAQFGSLGHLLAARALAEKIRTSPDPGKRTLLAVKVYAEFVASIEDLGALCIAVRHRDDTAGLVYAYLTYGKRRPGSPATGLRSLFELATEGDAVRSALNLPSLPDIQKAVPKASRTLVARLYRETNIVLAQAGSAYLASDGALVRAYNKAKHGFVVVSSEQVIRSRSSETVPNGCWIVADNPGFDLDNRQQEPMAQLFLVKAEEVSRMIDRIVMLRGAVKALCMLTAHLLESGAITCSDSTA